MGLQAVKVIHQKLVEHGLEDSTPAALVEQGTTENQRVHIATLETLAQVVEDKQVKAPTLIIVGGVVALHEQLNWYQPCAETQSS